MHELPVTPLPENCSSILVDEVLRPTRNSNGDLIHWSEEGVRNFWRAFDGIKTLDRHGRPLVAYHGTPHQFDTFEMGRETKNFSFAEYATRRAGAFFTPDKGFAQSFAKPGGGCLATYLCIKNPLILTDGYPNEFYLGHLDMLRANNLLCMRPEEMWEMFDEGFPGSEEFVAALQADGYDGALMAERNHDGYLTDVYVALRPEQIKSATHNSGLFDVANPEMRDDGARLERASLAPDFSQLMPAPNTCAAHAIRMANA